MKALLNVYRVQFHATMATHLQYRMGLVIWMISRILSPVIYLAVWSTVARSQGGAVGGFTPRDFAAYFIVLMLVNHTTYSWIMWEYEERIRHGTLSFALLRPIHPIHADIAENLSYKVLTMVVMLPTAAGLALVFRPELHPIPWAVAAFGPALLLAFVLRFLVEWTLAMLAFWTTRINAIVDAYLIALLFLSGQIAPLSLYPPAFQTLSTLLPFRWMVAFPVELLLGRLTHNEVLAGFVAQGLWLVLILALLTLIWRVGLRRYSAVGA